MNSTFPGAYHTFVTAGREFVEAYAELTHYVERLHSAATGPAGHAGPAEKPGAPTGHQH